MFLQIAPEVYHRKGGKSMLYSLIALLDYILKLLFC